MIEKLEVGQRIRDVYDSSCLEYTVHSIQFDRVTIRAEVAGLNDVFLTLNVEPVLRNYELVPKLHPRPDFKGWTIAYRNGKAVMAVPDTEGMTFSRATELVKYEDTTP